MSTHTQPAGVTGAIRGSIWLTGVIAAVIAAVATELFAAAAEALDVPLEAGSGTSGKVEEIPAGSFAMAVVVWTAVGTVLAAVIARKAKSPVRTFVTTVVVMASISLIGPFVASGDSTTATKVVLALSHVLAAAIVIPILARGVEARAA